MQYLHQDHVELVLQVQGLGLQPDLVQLGDGVGDVCDSCPADPNPSQGDDSDGDGIDDLVVLYEGSGTDTGFLRILAGNDVDIDGERKSIRAVAHTLSGYSAHADQVELRLGDHRRGVDQEAGGQEHGDDDWPADAAAREWRKEHAADGGAKRRRRLNDPG